MFGFVKHLPCIHAFGGALKPLGHVIRTSFCWPKKAQKRRARKLQSKTAVQHV